LGKRGLKGVGLSLFRRVQCRFLRGTVMPCEWTRKYSPRKSKKFMYMILFTKETSRKSVSLCLTV